MRYPDRRETDPGSIAWRKSTYSGHQGDCIQVADGIADAVPVRDSKTPDGPSLVFRAGAWAAFVSHLKDSG
ncbi:DUF397 domain-containing protein [Streptomyces nondiastaticus]|uniref:DUF397 domain-containing protein n=1 Tax=Streptomyces nondiastaticus TaxID=3154512 RepID=UPI00341BDDD4